MIAIKRGTGEGGKYLNTDLDAYLRSISAFATVDVAIVPLPASVGNSAAVVNAAIAGDDEKFVQEITLTLKNADDEVLTAFNGSVGPVSVVTIATDSADGTVVFDATTILDVNGSDKPVYVKGVATLKIEYTGDWLSTETVTLTITEALMAEANGGAAQTVVDTLIA